MKKLNKLVAILVAMAMVMALSIASAFAEEYTGPSAKSLDDAVLTKTLDVPAGVTSPAASFKFTFTPAEGTAPGTPTGLNKTITFEQGGTGDVTKYFPLSELFTLGATGNLKEAGLYIFTVDEDEANSSFTKVDETGANESMKYDTGTYTLRIYVVNDASDPTGLKIKDITVQDDDQAGTKVDPNNKTEEVEDPQPGEPTTQPTGEGSDFKFINYYTKEVKIDPNDPPAEQANGAFNIGKVVDGTMGDKTASYPFTVTVKLDAQTTADAAKTYTGKVGTEEYNFAFAKGETEKTVSNIMLKDGEKLVFELFPAGATVNIVENLDSTSIQNKALYYQEVTGATVNNNSAAKGADLDATTGIINDKAAVSVTNKLDDTDITPTGILMNNLPYIALALVAIGGLVAYVVVRRRQDNEA